MINKWNFQTPSEEELHKRDQLVAELGFSPVICLLLVQRGITSIEEAKKFFKPSLNDLHDPFLMPDMDKAVRRLNKALGNKEKILIYGDYDVDGTTAVSLVFKYLRPYSSTLDFYIPDRYDEGYGISYKGIDYAAENGVSLVISLDCGIKAIEKIEYAKEKGIDFWAYMVLEQGALSGKYDTAHPLPAGSQRGDTYNPLLPQIERLVAVMRTVGDKYSVTPAQVALAWAIAKGTTPIIGVTKPSQVQDAVRATQVVLTADEVKMLEDAAESTGVDTRGSWENPMI